MARMEAEGIKGNAVPYNVLIYGLCKNQRVYEAQAVKNYMVETGVTTDEMTYQTSVQIV
jgi:pentatricopeptide repeat protein